MRTWGDEKREKEKGKRKKEKGKGKEELYSREQLD
jgi:hypothetical protein